MPAISKFEYMKLHQDFEPVMSQLLSWQSRSSATLFCLESSTIIAFKLSVWITNQSIVGISNLQTEQHTSNRRAKSDRDTCWCSGWEYLTLPSFSEVSICLLSPPYSIYLPSFFRNGSNSFIKIFAQQQATCTSGPSLPNHKPDATARHWNQWAYT